MKKQIIAVLIFCFSAIYIGLFMGSSETSYQAPLVFVSKDAKAIQKTIALWASSGYKVQSISCQSVTIGDVWATDKGDIILVMTRY